MIHPFLVLQDEMEQMGSLKSQPRAPLADRDDAIQVCVCHLKCPAAALSCTMAMLLMHLACVPSSRHVSVASLLMTLQSGHGPSISCVMTLPSVMTTCRS